jgi:hypothetical protein
MPTEVKQSCSRRTALGIGCDESWGGEKEEEEGRTEGFKN